MLQRNIIYKLCLVLCFSCNKEQPQNPGNQFEFLSSSETGIHFINSIKNTQELNILNYLYFYNGGGVAIADFNNDNLPDIYFTANQGPDKLYLNKGNFHFNDITEIAAIDNSESWTTGVTTVDINNDKLLDIYVCKVGKHLSVKGHNLLYVNQGINEEGIPTFKEQSELYGLNIAAFSTQAAFFDYDKDHDLDLFLLNHSIYPNRNYGKGFKRQVKDMASGDRLYENKNGVFADVSENSGIFQGNIGYGLGIGISDLNNDNYPDIYIGNDFFENDYLYSNNKNKTFTELIHKNPLQLGHTTHFSMGNSIADINNDGLMDIVSLDMLPEDLKTYKRSGKEYDYQIYHYYLKNGYAPQFMQNTLHINRGKFNFSETAYLSNIAATEWSWSPLIADFDNDGFNDMYITNGILGATNDMDFINFIANEEIQKKIASGLTKSELKFIEKIPKKKTANYFFKNRNGLQFENITDHWLRFNKDSYSNGASYADLDNDGDLDIVVNNSNENAYILKNNTLENQGNTNYLKVHFKGPEKNRYGIGSKVTLYANHKMLTRENYTTRGYLSAIPPQLHFGLGEIILLDSLRITWPNDK